VKSKVRNGCHGKLIAKNIQVNMFPSAPISPELSLLNFLPLTYHHSHFLATTFDFTTFYQYPS